MMKHFVIFMQPGMMVAEESTEEIDGWNTEKALELCTKYTPLPYAFYFRTMQRTDLDWIPREIAKSGTYYINGTVKTLEEIKAEKRDSNGILIENMECNGWSRVVKTVFGNTQPFLEDDVNLEV